MGASNRPLSFAFMCLFSKMKKRGRGMDYQAIYCLRVSSLNRVVAVAVLLNRLTRRIFLQVMTDQTTAK